MTVLLFLLILVVLIVGHELGHFVSAKWTGMKVPEFGLGFPPKLWGKKVGDTEYTVNALPFGGFVKIVGEDTADEGAAADPAAFSNRPFLAQAATLLAGPFSNVFLALILSSLAFMVGVPAAADAGFDPAFVHDVKVIVVETLPGSPAAKAGIANNAEILSVTENGEAHAVRSADDVFQYVGAAGSGPVTLLLKEGDAARAVTVTPEKGVAPNDPDRFAIGLGAADAGTLVLPFFEAVKAGFSETLQNIEGVFLGVATFIGRAFTLSANFSDVAGPVGIASLVGGAAAFGLGSVLSFAALISVNLGVINLFPFPALDGGRLVMALYEALARRRIPASFTSVVNVVGFALLIVLMLAVTFHDITRLTS